MNRSLALTAVFLAALCLVACVAASPGGSPAPSVFTSPVDTPLPGSAPMTLDIAFDTPPTLNQPVTATVTLQTTEERANIVLNVTIIGPTGFTRRDFGVPIAAVHANQPLRVPVAFLFPVEGDYQIAVDVWHPRGGFQAIGGVYVRVTRAGSVVNPTSAPGSLSAPAQVAPGPFTPGPTPTRRPAGTPSPMTLDFAFDTPPTLNRPVTATVTLQTAEERTHLSLGVSVDGPVGFPSQQFSIPIAVLHANEPLRVPVALLFPLEGKYKIGLSLPHPRGGIQAIGGVYVQVSGSGSVINPTSAPGSLGAPAAAAAGPFTPGPTPTRRPTGTPSPGATPTASAGVPRSQGSVSAPASCSGSLITLSGSVQYDDRADAGTPNPRVAAPLVYLSAALPGQRLLRLS